jgi:hypothetical protein
LKPQKNNNLSLYIIMAPPLSKEQEDILKDIYYNQKMFFGRDKLFQYIKLNYPESKISRRQVMSFLESQETYQLNKPVIQKKSTRPVLTQKPGYIQIDLIDMQSYKERNFTFILTSVDTFTRKANAIPITQKSGVSISKALPKLLSVYDKVSVVQSDQGTEFLNPQVQSFFDSKGIKHITSKAYTPTSQGKIERFNGTLKRLIFQNISATNKNLWVQDLPKLVENYNSTIHRMTNKNPENVLVNDIEVKEKQSKYFNQNPQNTKVKDLKVGDRVRVVLKKQKLDKKSYNTYTKEIYTIVKKFKSNKPFTLPSYKLKDSDGDLIEGIYNASELQLIKE